MITLSLAQFIVLLVAFVLIKKIGKERGVLNALDFFIGSLVPLGVLVMLVGINQSLFSASEKYNSPGTLFLNFVLILPLGALFYYLKKLAPLRYRSWAIRAGGILLFLVIQTFAYILIPDLGY
jgi:hypothetical protein